MKLSNLVNTTEENGSAGETNVSKIWSMTTNKKLLISQLEGIWTSCEHFFPSVSHIEFMCSVFLNHIFIFFFSQHFEFLFCAQHMSKLPYFAPLEWNSFVYSFNIYLLKESHVPGITLDHEETMVCECSYNPCPQKSFKSGVGVREGKR